MSDETEELGTEHCHIGLFLVHEGYLTRFAWFPMRWREAFIMYESLLVREGCFQWNLDPDTTHYTLMVSDAVMGAEQIVPHLAMDRDTLLQVLTVFDVDITDMEDILDPRFPQALLERAQAGRWAETLVYSAGGGVMNPLKVSAA